MSQNDPGGEYRPVLLGTPLLPAAIKPPQGRSSQRLSPGSGGGRRTYLDGQFTAASNAFIEQIQLTASINASDPQLVLVLEAVEDRSDIVTAAERIGLEVVIEAESAFAPDGEYQLRSDRAPDPFIHSSLHAVCGDSVAFSKLNAAWATWKRTNTVPGNAPLRDLFSHLRDLRPWGPQDRLQMQTSSEFLDGLLPDVLHSVEIELWYRSSAKLRQSSESQVRTLIQETGGIVTASAEIDAIGYHGLKCEVPLSVLRKLADGEFDSVRLLKSANVMFLRVTGHSVLGQSETADDETEHSSTLPAGDPVVCLLDGVPAANHRLLSGRVVVFDPDDLATAAAVSNRKHGTHMASVVVWGDLSDGATSPAGHPVLVRPILAPSAHTMNQAEEIPDRELIPDLMRRVFRELFEGVDGLPPTAPNVVVVNLSVGDPATPYDTIMSSWARALDWLSHKYGVLVIASAGNHPLLPLSINQDALVALPAEDRRQAILDAQLADRLNRRLLAPAESINSLTVGAVHTDAAPGPFPPYLQDPTDGVLSVSPVSAFGGGYRRSLKPDLVAPGGRVVFNASKIGNAPIAFRNGGSIGPGVKVADPAGTETYIAGTSPAAAATTRYAAKLVDELAKLATSAPMTRRQTATAVKALIAHSTTPPPKDLRDHAAVDDLVGNGILTRDLTLGCSANEVTMLFMGSLRPTHSQTLLLPLPNGLSARGAKRVTATLAWLSPVNWRHRQYRQASLKFYKPGGGIPDLKSGTFRSHVDATRGANTVQQIEWEIESSFGVGVGDNLALTVQCFGQGGLASDDPIEYAVAVTLWVDDALGVDVYSQVAQQVSVRARQSVRL